MQVKLTLDYTKKLAHLNADRTTGNKLNGILAVLIFAYEDDGWSVVPGSKAIGEKLNNYRVAYYRGKK